MCTSTLTESAFLLQFKYFAHYTMFIHSDWSYHIDQTLIDFWTLLSHYFSNQYLQQKLKWLHLSVQILKTEFIFSKLFSHL